MEEEINRLLQENKITKEQAEKLLLLVPGQYRMHKTWGIGKVLDLNLKEANVTIDFQEKPKQVMALKLAVQKTEYLSSEDIRINLLQNKDSLNPKEKPLEWMRKVLENSGKASIQDGEIASFLIPHFFAKKEFENWWKNTKLLLRKSSEFQVSRTRPIEISLKLKGEEWINFIIKKLDSEKEAFAKKKVLDEIRSSKDFKISESSLLDALGRIGEFSSKTIKVQPQETISLLISRFLLLESLNQEEKTFSLLEVLQEREEELLEIFLAENALGQRVLCQIIPQVFLKDWEEKITSFISHCDENSISEIFSLMEKEKKEKSFFEEIEKEIISRSLSKGVLIWVCKNRKKISRRVFDFRIAPLFVQSLEDETLQEGGKSLRLKNFLFNDSSLLSDIVEAGNEDEIGIFLERLFRLHSFSSLDSKSLQARVVKTHPHYKTFLSLEEEKGESDSLLVSAESFERKKQELKNLTEKEIPQNIQDISIARSYGDLRENFEFKAAKQTQSVLNRRCQELEKEISLSEVKDFGDADTSSVNIGTSVFLKGKKEITYTILGAWDSDIDQGRVSYLSKIGQVLLRKKVGDIVEIFDFQSEKKAKLEIIQILPFKK